MTITAEALTSTRRADWMPGPPQGCWTYADYAALPDDGNRYEVLNGVLYVAAAPNLIHQTTVTLMGSHLVVHIQIPGKGRVFVAPTDVELPSGDTVQPDIVVVLNEHLAILQHTRIRGVPDLVVEVASPRTAGHDRRDKQDGYARAGVPEYWIAEPYSRTVEVLALEDGAYIQVGVFEGRSKLTSRVIPDLPVEVERFFA
jgi:Uma2 family endonuclease